MHVRAPESHIHPGDARRVGPMVARLAAWATLLLALLLSSGASAHLGYTGQTRLVVRGDLVEGFLIYPLSHLRPERLREAATARKQPPSPDERVQLAGMLRPAVLQHTHIFVQATQGTRGAQRAPEAQGARENAGGAECHLATGDAGHGDRVDATTDALTWRFTYRCPAPVRTLSFQLAAPVFLGGAAWHLITVTDEHGFFDQISQRGAALEIVYLDEPGLDQTLRHFLHLGFRHILSGLDHQLFLLGLVLSAASLGPLLGRLTAFTLGHALTVSAAALGALPLPSGVVEPLIALSIGLVGLGGLHATTQPHLAILALAFGLLHGLGFAGALATEHLPQRHLVAALTAFNMGIEFGQVILVALLWAVWHRLQASDRRSQRQRQLALGLASCGLFWFLLRLAGLHL